MYQVARRLRLESVSQLRQLETRRGRQEAREMLQRKEIPSALLGFSPKPITMSAIQCEEMNKPLSILFHSPSL